MFHANEWLVCSSQLPDDKSLNVFSFSAPCHESLANESYECRSEAKVNEISSPRGCQNDKTTATNRATLPSLLASLDEARENWIRWYFQKWKVLITDRPTARFGSICVRYDGTIVLRSENSLFFFVVVVQQMTFISSLAFSNGQVLSMLNGKRAMT